MGKLLKEYYPELLNEYDYNKNEKNLLETLTNGSGKKVWWLCKYGHEWEAAINPRTKRGVGCPECFKRTNTSFSEQSILYYFQKIFPKIKNRKRIQINEETFEADIYIEDLNIAVEYDGARTHK